MAIVECSVPRGAKRLSPIAAIAATVAGAWISPGCGDNRDAPSSDATSATLDLPDPLRFADGSAVTTTDEWTARRLELLDLFASEVYGRSPGRPDELTFAVLEEDAGALGGMATLERVAIRSRVADREHELELVVFTPNQQAAPSGVFLLINNRAPSATDPTRATRTEFWPVEDVIARGYAIAAIQGAELAPDDEATYTSGVIELFEGAASSGSARPPDAWKMIGAWAWGASRALDYLVTDSRIDPSRVAVIGHSRGGKAALWAGAQDERFSLTISNDSGCAGAALSRRPVGETVDNITAVFPHWFATNFRGYANNEAALPIDQHELLSLVAPRGLAVGSASDDWWADPEGEYLGLAYASSVFALWDAAPVPLDGMPPAGGSRYDAPRGYHLREGGHDLELADWQRYLDVADAEWARGAGRSYPHDRSYGSAEPGVRGRYLAMRRVKNCLDTPAISAARETLFPVRARTRSM